MKLVIAGSRTIALPATDMWSLMLLHDLDLTVKEIVSGGAKGVDTCAEYMARAYEVPFKKFPADWDKYGKGAGHIRNKQMADYGDALLLVWDGESKGSANMKANMEKLKKPVYEIILKGPDDPARKILFGRNK